MVKDPPADVGDPGDVGSIPGPGKSPGERNGNPLQYSCLGNPKGRGAWRAIVHGVAKEWDTTELLSTEARGPRKGRGRQDPRTQGNFGKISESRASPHPRPTHTHPARASCDIVHHSPPASPSPCPKRSSRPWRAAPRRIPSRGHQAEGAGVFRGSSPAPSPAQGSQVCCVGWLQLSATEDRCYRSSVSTHRALVQRVISRVPLEPANS